MNVLGNGHIQDRAQLLRNDGDAIGERFSWRGVVNCPSFAQHGSRVGLLKSNKNVQESRFAGTVAPTESMNAPTPEFDATVEKSWNARIGLGNADRTEKNV